MKANKTTKTVRISEKLKSSLDDLGNKSDTYEIILRRLVCLHKVVMERDSTLIDEARKRASIEEIVHAAKIAAEQRQLGKKE